MKKRLSKINDHLVASWFGVFSFESVEYHQPELMDEFYNCDINNPAIRKLAIEKIALPYLNDIDFFKEDGENIWKTILSEALALTDKELHQIFDFTGMVFMQPNSRPPCVFAGFVEYCFS